MVKIGIIGSLEQIESNLASFMEVEEMTVSGVFLSNESNSNNSNLVIFKQVDELFGNSDAVFIFESTENLYEIVLHAFRKNIHVLIEQISSLALDKIDMLLKSRKEANVKCMLTSTELSHPAYLAIQPEEIAPLFIESQRDIYYNKLNRQHIILDLLLKDLAVILNLVKSEIKQILTCGIKVMFNTIDFVQVRLEFSNGVVANLSVNKSAPGDRNSLTIYQENKIIAIDFQNNSTNILTKSIENENELISNKMKLQAINPFTYQLENFRDSILGHGIPILKLRDGYEKLAIAHRILKKINSLNHE